MLANLVYSLKSPCSCGNALSLGATHCHCSLLLPLKGNYKSWKCSRWSFYGCSPLFCPMGKEQRNKEHESNVEGAKDSISEVGMHWRRYAINLNMHSIAINLTSATVASAAANLTPVFTFILALLFREEMISLKTCSGIAKAIGVLICFTGTAIIAFYKGPYLNSFITHHPILHGSSQIHSTTLLNKNWIIGTFLMVLVTLCWALWFVLQGKLLKEYPSWIWSSALVSLFSSLQCFVVAIAVERSLDKWKLHWDEGLLAIVYTGVMMGGLVLYLHTWCIHKKGPVFVVMFTPLSLVITIAASSFLLGEVTNLGCVLGGAFMVVGLYSVLWGKSKERKNMNSNVEGSEISISKVEVV